MHLRPKDITKSNPLPKGHVFLTFGVQKPHLLPKPSPAPASPGGKKQDQTQVSFQPHTPLLLPSLSFSFYLLIEGISFDSNKEKLLLV